MCASDGRRDLTVFYCDKIKYENEIYVNRQWWMCDDAKCFTKIFETMHDAERDKRIGMNIKIEKYRM